MSRKRQGQKNHQAYMLAAEKETGGWSAVELAIEKQFRDEELYVNGAKTVFTFFNFAILLLSSLAFLLQPFFARPNDSNRATSH